MCASPLAFAKFGSGLDEESLNALKKAWDSDPGAIIKNIRVLRQLSADQISDLMEYKDTSHYSFLHVVTIKGEELSNTVLGNPNNKLSVMVVIDNRLKPIPFQIDEVDITGLTFIPEIKKYDIDGKEDFFDKQDELVFMYRDANYERYEEGKTLLPRGKILKEVVLTFQDRKPRYAYVVKDNNLRSEVNYVNMNIEQGNFNST